MKRNWIWICLFIHLIAPISAGLIPPQIEFQKKSRNIDETLCKLYMIKYIVMIFGAKVSYMNLDSIDEFNENEFRKLIENNISLNTLRSTFPKFGMLVPSHGSDNRSHNILVRATKSLWQMLKWALELCKELWIPTKRSETVSHIEYCLDIPITGQSSDDIENSVSNQIMTIESYIQTLDGTLSSRCLEWVTSFNSFIQVWKNINQVISEYKDNKSNLETEYFLQEIK